ncbi:hypothetical protein [Shimia haliotis]|uniref:Outer membrane protein beta-barrel domain-containing protein n=1 Tax=Shimia haliotis TaxID=1280847 RepID=A0A1I4H3S2_9RHOB|nr:hypothetical protein [Shimia haliotis]SFL36962.1 hypothetical protein SAMN04488036_11118 [Shimia haliotis]
MKTTLWAVGFLLSFGVTQTTTAETRMFGELGLEFGGYNAGGNGVNTTGFPFDEPGSLNALNAFGDIGAVYNGGFAWRFSAQTARTDTPLFNGFGVPTNEGPKAASQAVITLGQLQSRHFVGGFAGLGSVGFVGDDSDQNATYRLLGIGGAYQAGAWSHGASLSFMDVIETADPETLSDAGVLKLQSEYALDADTQVGVFAAYFRGEMDWDGATADPVDGGGFGVYVRHRVGQVGGRPLMLNAGVSRTLLNEMPPSADHSLWVTRLHVGISVVFGKGGVPALMRVGGAPDMTTTQMFNPMLD